MGRWQRVIDTLVNNSISQAGVFDLNGKALACCKDLLLHERSAKALIIAFGDKSGGLFGIHVGSELFKCYRAGEKVIVGKSSDGVGNVTMFACMLMDECLVFCMMNGASCSARARGSVIGVMKAAVNNSLAPPISSKLQMPVDCRVEILNEDLPLIDLEIRS